MFSRIDNVILKVFEPCKNEEGQALAEYGILLGLIAIVAIVALTLLGGAITGKLDLINAALGGGGSA